MTVRGVSGLSRSCPCSAQHYRRPTQPYTRFNLAGAKLCTPSHVASCSLCCLHVTVGPQEAVIALDGSRLRGRSLAAHRNDMSIDVIQVPYDVCLAPGAPLSAIPLMFQCWSLRPIVLRLAARAAGDQYVDACGQEQVEQHDSDAQIPFRPDARQRSEAVKVSFYR